MQAVRDALSGRFDLTNTESACVAMMAYLRKFMPGLSSTVKMAQVNLTIAGSGNSDVDLAGGVTDGETGLALTFARVRSIIVHNKVATGANACIVGNAAANGFVGPFGAAAHTITVQRGSMAILTNGLSAAWAVTAGTGDLLRFANSGAGAAIQVEALIVGDTV